MRGLLIRSICNTLHFICFRSCIFARNKGKTLNLHNIDFMAQCFCDKPDCFTSVSPFGSLSQCLISFYVVPQNRQAPPSAVTSLHI